MWGNIVERGRPQMALWRMRIARWIPKARDPQTVYVTLITFPQDLWLRERALVFRIYVHCLSRDSTGVLISP